MTIAIRTKSRRTFLPERLIRASWQSFSSIFLPELLVDLFARASCQKSFLSDHPVDIFVRAFSSNLLTRSSRKSFLSDDLVDLFSGASCQTFLPGLVIRPSWQSFSSIFLPELLVDLFVRASCQKSFLSDHPVDIFVRASRIVSIFLQSFLSEFLERPSFFF